MALWKFAAKHKFRNLAAHCLEYEVVFLLIKESLSAMTFGVGNSCLESFLQKGYCHKILSDLIRKLLSSENSFKPSMRCDEVKCLNHRQAGGVRTTWICAGCRKWYGD